MNRIATAASVLVFVSCATTPAPRPAAVAVTGVDCHMHAQSSDGKLQSAEALLKALDEAGLSHGCVLAGGSHLAPGCADRTCEAQRAFTQQRNDEVLELAQGSQGRLLPFCGIPVTAGFSPAEVERCATRGGRGLKLHLVNEAVSLADTRSAGREQLRAVLEAASRHRLPVLIHVRMDDAAEVRAFFAVVAGAPAATVVAAHQIAPNLTLLPEAPSNLWIELSGLTHAPAEAGGFFVPVWRDIGLNRVLFGSDWPMLSPAAHVAMLRRYPLTEAEQRQILRDNAARLFSLQ